MIQFQQNAWTDRRTEGRKDGQTLSYSTLPGTAGGPKNILTAAYDHGCLKSKNSY